MTRIELGFNSGIDIDLPPEYEHSHEFPPDPQAFWDAMIPIMRKLVESHPRTYNYQRGDRSPIRQVRASPYKQTERAEFSQMTMDDRVEKRLEDFAPWAEEREEDFAPCRVDDRLEDYADCAVEERDGDSATWDEERLEDYAVDFVQESDKGAPEVVPKLKSSALSDREVVRLYDALSFALWQFGPSAIMTVHIIILWRTLEVTEHTQARHLTGARRPHSASGPPTAFATVPAAVPIR